MKDAADCVADKRHNSLIAQEEKEAKAPERNNDGFSIVAKHYVADRSQKKYSGLINATKELMSKGFPKDIIKGMLDQYAPQAVYDKISTKDPKDKKPIADWIVETAEKNILEASKKVQAER